MPLPVLSFQELQDNQAAAMQASFPSPLNFNQGSVLLALIQSNAGNSIWLQALATTLLAVTRLSTSSGNDCDTFCADFGFYRSQGLPAQGTVTFSRFNNTVTGTIPVGALVSTSTTNLNFTVLLDTTNPYYNSALNAYVVPISVASTDLVVQCNTSGTLGNVATGAINTINNPALMPGIDNVINYGAFVTGLDPWTDTQFKQEFLLYINSLSRATLQAIEYAVSSVEVEGDKVWRYNIVENMNTSNMTQLGFFYVVIDDGTGSTVSSTLLDAVIANVELYRGLTIAYSVQAALFTAITITVSVNLIPNPTESDEVITQNITTALQNYALSIPFNQPFLYSKISEIVYLADANVLSIPSSSAPVLNSGTTDVAGDNLHVFGIPTITVIIL